MNILFILSLLTFFLVIPSLVITVGICTAKPDWLRQLAGKYFSRVQILSVGFGSVIGLTILTMVVMATTVPASFRQRVEADNLKQMQVQLTAQKQQEQTRLRQEKESHRPKESTEIKLEAIPFESIEQNAPDSLKGERRIAMEGKNGERTLTYTVIRVDDKEVKRTEISNKVTTEPVKQVTLVGTRIVAAPNQLYGVPQPKTAPSPAPPSASNGNYVHPGSFCAPTGAVGIFSSGNAAVCKPAIDGRNRWQRR